MTDRTRRTLDSARTFDLERYLPYLINRAGVRLTALAATSLLRHAMTLKEWRVMSALHQENGLRVTDLSHRTSIDVSTLSRVLKAMQEKGLVERRRAGGGPRRGDQRVVTVHATETAQEFTARSIPLALCIERRALQGFSMEEEQALKAMLVRVFRNLDAVGRAA